MAKDPTAVAAKWAQNLSASTESIKAGIMGVTRAPGAAAAAQKAVYLANVTASADKWAQRVAAVTLNQWQDAAITKGLPRIATGAQAAQPKFATFMGSLLPFIENGRAQLPARGSLEQNLARMTSWARYMATYQKPAGS